MNNVKNNSERPVDALAEKHPWLTDKLKSRDASASKNADLVKKHIQPMISFTIIKFNLRRFNIRIRRWRHDDVKLCIVNICNQSKVRAEAEVFGWFRDLLPPHLFDQGGGLHHGRQRVGLTPDLLLRIPTS